MRRWWKKAREEGKEVELNDDNQIVDKRDLLVAGLNLSAPNTRRLGDRSKTDVGKTGEEVQAHRAVGTAATRREINERRAREIQQQMEDEEERLKREKERAGHKKWDFASLKLAPAALLAKFQLFEMCQSKRARKV